MKAWSEARERPFLGQAALQAFHHVNPFRRDEEGNVLGDVIGATIATNGTITLKREIVREEVVDLATVGALLEFEKVIHSRGMVEKPMTIQFLSGGPKVVPVKLDEGEDPKTLPADRTGVPEGSKGDAA